MTEKALHNEQGERIFRFEHSLAIAISAFTNPFILLLFVLTVTNWSSILNSFDNFALFVVITVLPTFLYYINLIRQHKKHPLHFVAISQDKRNSLYLLCIFCLAFNIVFFAYVQDRFWTLHALVFLIGTSLFYLINKYIGKASMHAAAYTFSILYLADRVSMSFAILFIGLPIIFWSRIKLHKHSWLELLLGTSIGMIIGLLSWTIR